MQSFLYPILIRLIPGDFALNFNRKRFKKSDENEFNVLELLRYIKIEMEYRESSLMLNPFKDTKQKHTNPPDKQMSKNDFKSSNSASALNAQIL